MGIEKENDFREDILGLKTALDVLDNCGDKIQRQKILGLMLLMIERIEITIHNEVKKMN